MTNAGHGQNCCLSLALEPAPGRLHGRSEAAVRQNLNLAKKKSGGDGKRRCQGFISLRSYEARI